MRIKLILTVILLVFVAASVATAIAKELTRPASQTAPVIAAEVRPFDSSCVPRAAPRLLCDFQACGGP